VGVTVIVTCVVVASVVVSVVASVVVSVVVCWAAVVSVPVVSVVAATVRLEAAERVASALAAKPPSARSTAPMATAVATERRPELESRPTAAI